MAYFEDLDEIDTYIGEMFRIAADHEKVGAKFRAADIVLRVLYSDPDCEVTICMQDDYRVIAGPTDAVPDVTLMMRGDIADRYWRGTYNLAVGLAKGEVKAKGPVNKILKMVPLTKPLFPVYRELVADKDASAV